MKYVMDDREFIAYCELHCRTPRALFHRDHVARLYELAGEPVRAEEVRKRLNEFFIVREEQADPLCTEARKRMMAHAQKFPAEKENA